MATAAVQPLYPHITKDPRVCGGKACIESTRVRVLDIVGLLHQGYTPEKMLDVYASPLTLGQVHAALTYYYDHTEEIEAAIEDDRRTAAQIEQDRAEHLRQSAK